jgi:hypothetical protein
MIAPYSTKAITPGMSKPRMRRIITTFVHWLKRNTSDEKEATQNTRGSNKRPSMKKEATQKYKGLK